MTVFIVMLFRAPGVQKSLWRNYLVILAAITNATTLPTGFPEIFDLLLKLFHLFLFTPMLLEHVRLLAGMANLPALEVVLKTQIYTSFQGILGNLKPRLREDVLVCLRVGCYMLHIFRIVRFLFPSHVRTHMLCAMQVQLGLRSSTHIYFEEIKSLFCLLMVYISYM